MFKTLLLRLWRSKSWWGTVATFVVALTSVDVLRDVPLASGRVLLDEKKYLPHLTQDLQTSLLVCFVGLVLVSLLTAWRQVYLGRTKTQFPPQ